MRTITHNGNTLTIRQWSGLKGVPVCIIRQRLARGWEGWRAVSVPVREYLPTKAQAATLGISVNAVYMRRKRGTL